jgi:hypothetical protein
VFLIGVLHDRLVRSDVGELFVELRADPAPADLRDALARALRDPSLIPRPSSHTDRPSRLGSRAASAAGVNAKAI